MHNNGYTIRLNASAFFPCADGGTLLWLCVDNRSPCKGKYVFSPTNGLWRTKSCRATVTAELCENPVRMTVVCMSAPLWSHEMPSRFQSVLSLVATGHDAVTKCWGTFVKTPCRGQLKTISTILTKVSWKRFRHRWFFLEICGLNPPYSAKTSQDPSPPNYLRHISYKVVLLSF